MTLKSPQSDLPRSLSGAADLWDVEQAGVLLTAEFFQDITQVVLSGAGAAQPNTATAGAVSQDHRLAGAGASAQNTSASGAVSQTPALAGADAATAGTSASGGIIQAHLLAGAGAVQVNTSLVLQTTAITPSASRTWRVIAERRRITIQPERRRVTISAERRTFRVR